MNQQIIVLQSKFFCYTIFLFQKYKINFLCVRVSVCGFKQKTIFIRAKTMVSHFLNYRLGPTTVTSAISSIFCLTILTLYNGRLTIFPHQIK